MSESVLFACACQIVRAMSRMDWFLSNGQREVFGQIASLELFNNGLRLVMSNHEKVWWAMKGSEAKIVASLVELMTGTSPTSQPNACQCGDLIESGKFYRSNRFDHVYYHDSIGQMFGHLVASNDGTFTVYRPDKLIETTTVEFDKIIWIV